MLLEKILFILIAFSLFIIIFCKIIKKNDTNYVAILIMQIIGIAICCFELNLGMNASIILFLIRYITALVIPGTIIYFEKKGTNFSEVISLSKAKIYLNLGNQRKAKEELVFLTDKYENSYLGHKLLAEIYEKEGGMRKAIDEYVKALDINKRDYKSYFRIAKLLNDLDKKDEAIEMLQTLVKTQPDCYDASILLGEMLCEQSRFKEAANVYLDALKYKPLDFELYYNLGIVYTRLSDFQQAKEMYEKAAEINHLLYGAYYNLALIALIQKELDSAQEYFEKCLYDEDLEPMAYYNLAKIAMLKGDREKAILFLNKAIELDQKLLKKANAEKIFEGIKQFITVSVQMEEKKKKVLKKKTKIEENADIARVYLENTNELVEDIKENTNKQKITDRVSLIIDAEKLRQQENIEDVEKTEEMQQNQKEIVDDDDE